MKHIRNLRPGILLLPESKLIFKAKASITVETISDEVQKAIDKGWVKLESDEEEKSLSASNTDQRAHDWEVDYSRIEENLVTITDALSGRSVTGEIQEKKGNQHYTLKDVGTVKRQQYWPKAHALEQIDAAE
ncbi:MAG: hypothetical protein H8E18_02240 [FCB group bacterium]|nr:hypothetical protein [FCB group bacterium]